MIDDAKVSALLARVRREVDEGLLPAAQVAIGFEGEVVVDETFGAPAGSRFVPSRAPRPSSVRPSGVSSATASST